MGKVGSILSENQQRVLSGIANEKFIGEYFYLGGGTALAEYYLHHRYSEDLDFFSEREFDPQAVLAIFKKLKKTIAYKNIDVEQSFNRNLFFLHLGADTIKMEFTYYPFPRIEKGKKVGCVRIDSLLDIVVNKVFTIYQKPRARDYIDLYLTLQKEKKWTIQDLVKKAQVKFDWHVDTIQLGSQFLQAEVVKDYPRVIADVKPEVWQKFFVDEAKKLQRTVLGD